MFKTAKGKQQKQARQLQCQEQCIDHVPYYLLGLSRAHFFQQPFAKQLQNKGIIHFLCPRYFVFHAKFLGANKVHSGRCASLEYQFQHKRTSNSAVWLGMARPVPYTCTQLNHPGSGSHGQLQLISTAYPDVSLSKKMCGQRKVGRRQRARRRFACRLYPSHGPSWFITSR